jgi:hypothetical protein
MWMRACDPERFFTVGLLENTPKAVAGQSIAETVLSSRPTVMPWRVITAGAGARA